MIDVDDKAASEILSALRGGFFKADEHHEPHVQATVRAGLADWCGDTLAITEHGEAYLRVLEAP